MSTIYKYELRIQDIQIFEVPLCCNPLCVQIQNDRICLWAIVNGESGGELEVYIVGTGNPMPHNKIDRYIGTVQLDGFVWHVFTRFTVPMAVLRKEGKR